MGVKNDRCAEIYNAIGDDLWEDITPESATCLTVDRKCIKPDAFDYYGPDLECIKQWKDFDLWCWNDPTHDENQCERINREYEES